MGYLYQPKLRSGGRSSSWWARPIVWMGYDCGASMARRIDEDDRAGPLLKGP
jgi:hypothetical protein